MSLPSCRTCGTGWNVSSTPENRTLRLENGNGTQEVKTMRPGDEAAPEQGGDDADVRLHTHEREEKREETMMMAFRALDRELKYIQDSLYLHIRYSMIRVKHVGDERQRVCRRARGSKSSKGVAHTVRYRHRAPMTLQPSILRNGDRSSNPPRLPY